MTDIADYKQAFIDLMLECGVLTFGDFTTKSGRRTPYFVNSGNFNNGYAVSRLGAFYARALMDNLNGAFDNLYGPAYKGIPLASVTAGALYQQFQKNVSYTFNRKEVKDHGEGGVFVGQKYKGGERVVIIEDVITAGTSVRESVPLLQGAGDIRLAGLVISVDRMEKGRGEQSALQEIQTDFNMPAFAIVTLDEIVAYLSRPDAVGRIRLDEAMLERIAEYRAEYGIASSI